MKIKLPRWYLNLVNKQYNDYEILETSTGFDLYNNGKYHNSYMREDLNDWFLLFLAVKDKKLARLLE